MKMSASLEALGGQHQVWAWGMSLQKYDYRRWQCDDLYTPQTFTNALQWISSLSLLIPNADHFLLSHNCLARTLTPIIPRGSLVQPGHCQEILNNNTHTVEAWAAAENSWACRWWWACWWTQTDIVLGIGSDGSQVTKGKGSILRVKTEDFISTEGPTANGPNRPAETSWTGC